MTCCKVTWTITTIKIDNLLFGGSTDPLTKVYHSQSKVFNLFNGDNLAFINSSASVIPVKTSKINKVFQAQTEILSQSH